VRTTGEVLALGLQHHRRGALDEAGQLYRQVLQAEPQHPEALCYLGVVAYQVGRPDLALENISRSITLKPGVAAFHRYLGLAYEALGRTQDAVASYEQALRCDPEDADAHNNLGVALQRLGRPAEATACFERAVRCNPDSAEACSNLGAAYQHQGRLAEAIASFHHAARCKPDFAPVYVNLGMAYLTEGMLDEAVAFNRQAVLLKPDYAEAYYNLGVAFQRLHRLDDALANFQQALRLNSDFAMAHLGRAHTLLLAGDFAQGWPEHEWRARCPPFGTPSLRGPQPAWDGSALGGRILLLRAEQGIGDTLQFIRYASVIKLQRGQGRIIVEAQAPVLPLLRTCPGVDQTIAQGDSPPPFDVQALLLSLPGLLGTSLANVPADVPYLAADPALVAHWRSELSHVQGFKVGIVWQGSSMHLQDRRRSISLPEFAPLATVEGVHLFSLQVGPGHEQLAALAGRFPVTDLGVRFDSTSFADAAAVVMTLDLVVTVDTALAHLAGALGVPVWVVLPFSPDWRWLLGREDSPWYPSMRLFRQAHPGDWAEVFLRIREALRARLGR